MSRAYRAGNREDSVVQANPLTRSFLVTVHDPICSDSGNCEYNHHCRLLPRADRGSSFQTRNAGLTRWIDESNPEIQWRTRYMGRSFPYPPNPSSQFDSRPTSQERER